MIPYKCGQSWMRAMQMAIWIRDNLGKRPLLASPDNISAAKFLRLIQKALDDLGVDLDALEAVDTCFIDDVGAN